MHLSIRNGFTQVILSVLRCLVNTLLFMELMHTDIKMVIPAYGLDIHGFPAIWAVRQSMGTAKLNPHLVCNHTFVGDHVLKCYVTVINPATGATAQLSDATFTFDSDCRHVVRYDQENLFSA